MKKILLIEDDLALRENTAELLELSGYEVTTASNGKIGIETAMELLPDLIVCDIMMPEVNGYGVLQAISEKEATKNIPFIFLSAKTEHKEIRKGMDMGADDYLTKPFEEEDLISAVESRLAKSILLSRLGNQGASETSHTGDRLNNLAQLKLFFSEKGQTTSYKKGEMIFNEGEPSNRIYLILNGLVKCHKMDEDGKELITSLYKKEDFLGFTSFLDNIPYQESATVIEAVQLAWTTKDTLKSILEENHTLSMELMELFSDNLTEIKGQLLHMAYSSVRKKTAQTLLQFAEILGKDTEEPIKISRTDLASVAGIATESLIRTLSGFKKEGLIAIEGRNIRIVELKALQYVN
ncbi:response regulator [Arenibacter sp. 6A1]|uniref:response regulator n=1 Tax=Arenibacter sp. 6A1 TaxID=2720391 RepID=UPI0014459686|nr:response regulator [Arenibacter sp. 6A1]NKI25752.1 response regulator [Arenibacter sp. 6A1]